MIAGSSNIKHLLDSANRTISGPICLSVMVLDDVYNHFNRWAGVWGKADDAIIESYGADVRFQRCSVEH